METKTGEKGLGFPQSSLEKRMETYRALKSDGWKLSGIKCSGKQSQMHALLVKDGKYMALYQDGTTRTLENKGE